MSALRAPRFFEVKDVVYPETYLYASRYICFRRGTRLAKEVANDKRVLSALCYIDANTDKYVKELEETCLAAMGAVTPEQMVTIIDRSLTLIHKNRRAQWKNKQVLPNLN